MTTTEAFYLRSGLYQRLAMARETGASAADIREIERRLREVERQINRGR